MCEMHGKTSARCSDGMSDCNSTAIDVDSFRIEPQFTLAGDRLNGERFVDLDIIELVDAPTVIQTQFTNGVNRPQPHSGGVTALGRSARKSGKDRPILLDGKLGVRDNEHCGSIVNP